MAEKSLCSIPGCDKPRKHRGKCEPHYRSSLATGDRERERRGFHLVCSVSGCGAKHRCRGLCARHYDQWKRRSVVRKRATPGTRAAYIEAAITSSTDECLVWALARPGVYLKVNTGGRQTSVSRIVCERVHGPPASPDLEACHSCHNPPCINPRHLRWGTGAENQADRVQDGTHGRGDRNPIAKLSAEQVRFIRANPDAPVKELATLCNVKPTTIYSVRSGKSWAHV